MLEMQMYEPVTHVLIREFAFFRRRIYRRFGGGERKEESDVVRQLSRLIGRDS